jgi:hypothetical protein
MSSSIFGCQPIIYPGGSSTNLQEALNRIFESLQSKSLAKSSSAQYANTWSQWTQWCGWLNFSKWLPATPQKQSYQLALFATYCWKFGWGRQQAGNSPSTVLSKISHISWYHRKTLGYGVELLPGHKMAITGMRRSDPPRNPKAPVTTAILRQMHTDLNFTSAQHRVIWGASVLGFYFLLQRSEYLAHGRKVQAYVIQRADVSFSDKHGGKPTSLATAATLTVAFRGSHRSTARAGSQPHIMYLSAPNVESPSFGSCHSECVSCRPSQRYPSPPGNLPILHVNVGVAKPSITSCCLSSAMGTGPGCKSASSLLHYGLSKTKPRFCHPA